MFNEGQGEYVKFHSLLLPYLCCLKMNEHEP